MESSFQDEVWTFWTHRYVFRTLQFPSHFPVHDERHICHSHLRRIRDHLYRRHSHLCTHKRGTTEIHQRSPIDCYERLDGLFDTSYFSLSYLLSLYYLISSLWHCSRLCLSLYPSMLRSAVVLLFFSWCCALRSILLFFTTVTLFFWLIVTLASYYINGSNDTHVP